MGLGNNTKMTSLVVVVMVCMVVAAPAAEAAITCSLVASKVAICVSYLQGGPGPSQPCCNGVRALAAAASTPADRRTACVCLQKTGSAFPGFYKYAAGLPSKCGVSVPYPISPNTDCSKIN